MYLVELVYSERPSIFTRTLTLLRAFCVNDFVFCSFYIHSFFCHIYTIRTRDIIIITQQVYTYHVLSVLSTDRQVFANRHRTVGDEGLQKTIPPCPLSASIITCLKCANDPITQAPCVCLYIRHIRKEIETHRKDRNLSPF